MSTDTGGTLAEVYANRIGTPTTHDEVRGYWIFLTGLVLAVVGFVLFLPSGSAAGASGLTLREVSIALAAVGLAMIVAGPVVRLPLKSWANYAAYLGQLVCFLAVVWFILVFPGDWNVQTGNQPVVILYAVGLGTTMLGGALVPLIVGATREDLEATQRRAADLEENLRDLRRERDRLETELEDAREAGATDADRAEGLEADLAELESQLESLRASQAQFELYEDAGGQYRWRLRHRNGNVVADGGQGYTRKHNAKKGLASVRRNALGASLLEIEPDPEEGEDPEKALEEAPLVPDVEESQATFEVYEDEAGDYRWRLVHDNGNVIADGGQGYASERNARDGIASVKRNAGPASYLQFDPVSFEVYRDNAGEWRWRLVHKNGNIIAAASEGYTRRRDASRSVDTVQETLDDDAFEVYEDASGDHRWRLTAANNEVIATSGEGYSSEAEAHEAVERVQAYAPEADSLDVGFAAFEVYRDEADEWRWRLRHRNGEVIADGGQGYASRHGAHDAIESVKRNAPGAETTEA
ncbi:MAG: HVO_2922 family protein [Haloarculaceae archaeon]